MEEPDIIEGCVRNDPSAQRYLFDRYYRRSYHVAMRYLVSHHDTEDVLSMSYTKVFKSIGKLEYRGEGSLQKWIYTIVINEAIRFLKSKKTLVFTEDEEILDLNPISGHDTLDAEEVYHLVQMMPKGYQTVFNLFAIEGYSHKEIADMLQIKETTSRSQLSKARNYIIEKIKFKRSHAIK